MHRQDYVIMTDSNSELPLSVAKKFHVPFVQMPYIIDGVEIPYDLGEKTDLPAFFAKMRGGSVPTTVTYPPAYYIELWEPILTEGKDILFLAFSSRLSNAFQFLSAAALEAREMFPQRRIELFDTRTISGGMAVLVYAALRRYSEGASMDEVLAWLEANRLRANAYFTVGDLVYLKRGGRISATSAVVGGMLNIKPLLVVTAEGTIVSVDKVRGRAKSIRTLADLVAEKAEDPEENVCVILHGDCESDAVALKEMIEEKVAFNEMYIQYVGPVIGTHAGPDTLAVCFLGKPRG